MVMRLLLATTLTLFTLVPAVAQQPVEPCGDWRSFDWRTHFGFGPADLVWLPEFMPEPVSDTLVSRIPPRGSSPQGDSISIVVAVVDTAGVVTDVDVACAPSEAVAAEIAALIRRSEFSPARSRGRPIRHFVVLPLLASAKGE